MPVSYTHLRMRARIKTCCRRSASGNRADNCAGYCGDKCTGNRDKEDGRTYMKKYVMALDQGTTSSRCILFDKKGNICSVAQKEFEQIYPKPGWVEHDPMEIWASQLSCLLYTSRCV